jgi:hypothetical protein
MKKGKVQKVAALDKVLQICSEQGASYNPGNESLQPTAMRLLLEQAQQKTEAVNVTRSAYAMAVNARNESFRGIPKLAAQVARMVTSSKASADDKEEVRMIKRKLNPARKKKSESDSQTQPVTTEPAKGVRSTSQLDREGMMNNFHQLIEAVAVIDAYRPNEPEFSVENLRAKLAQLQQQCEVARAAAIRFSNARIDRDKVLFGAGGAVEITQQAKDYIRAKFGARSQQSLQTRPTMNF